MRFKISGDIFIEIDKSYDLNVVKRNRGYEVVAAKKFSGQGESTGTTLYFSALECDAESQQSLIEEMIRRENG